MSKIRETVEINEQPGVYHIPGCMAQGGSATLCAWVDVPLVIHDAADHPVNCDGCLGILKFCKRAQV